MGFRVWGLGSYTVYRKAQRLWRGSWVFGGGTGLWSGFEGFGAGLGPENPILIIKAPILTLESRVDIGALIIKIGFGAHYTTVIIRRPQNSIRNYLDPYIRGFKVHREARRCHQGLEVGFKTWMGLPRASFVSSVLGFRGCLVVCRSIGEVDVWLVVGAL